MEERPFCGIIEAEKQKADFIVIAARAQCAISRDVTKQLSEMCEYIGLPRSSMAGIFRHMERLQETRGTYWFIDVIH